MRHTVQRDGTRQIMSFHVPGDNPDLQSLHVSTMDHDLATISASKVAFIPHDALRDLCHADPLLADKLWRDTLIDGALFREWIVNTGSREAPNRIAHLLCEVFLKLQAVGLTNGYAFDFPSHRGNSPMRPESTIHVNCSMQKLRADGLIEMSKGRCIIPDWDRLTDFGMFDPTYLHLQSLDEA